MQTRPFKRERRPGKGQPRIYIGLLLTGTLFYVATARRGFHPKVEGGALNHVDARVPRSGCEKRCVMVCCGVLGVSPGCG